MRDYVLIVTPEYPPYLAGGVGRYTFELRRELASAGYDTVVLCVPTYATLPGGGSGADRATLDADVFLLFDQDYRRLFRDPDFAVERYRARSESLARRAAASLPDGCSVVFVQDYHTASIARILTDVLGAGCLLYFAHLPLSARFSYFLKSGTEEQQQALEAAACLWSDRTFVPSRFAARALSLVQSISPDRISVAPLAVRPRAPSPRKDRDPPLIATVGRMTQQKGWDQLIDVIARVERAQVSYRLAVVGDGPWRREVWSALRAVLPSSRLELYRWLDPAEALPALLDRSTIYLQTSSYESFGLAALEAAAAQSVPVLTEVGPFAEFFSAESGAILVEPGRTDLAADAVTRLLRSSEERSRRASQAGDYAGRFSWCAHLSHLEPYLRPPRERIRCQASSA